MFTTRGKVFIKRFLAGQAAASVGAISAGIGQSAEDPGDERLQFEFARFPVSNFIYDFATDRIIFKGSIPADVSGKIYEVGLWTTQVDPQAGNQGSRIITSFDSETEVWDVETIDTTTNRIGADSLVHTPAASATTASVMGSLTMSFIDNSSDDEFVMAYNVGNANTAEVIWRFRKDSSNYYEFKVLTPTTGYKFSTFAKGSATIVGTPSWDEVNELQVATVATAGGTASVSFDGIRIEDVDTVSPDYGLITRFVLPSPIVKEEGSVQDFEYSLDVTI